jgi:hypothetical protein
MRKSTHTLLHLCLAIVVASLVLACASPIKTAFDTDPNVDMSTYKTYAWVGDGSGLPAAGSHRGPYVSPLDDQRIRREVDGSLQSKGYATSDPAQADIMVDYGVRAEEKLRVTETPGRSTYYARGYRYGTWYAGSSVNVQQYTEGTMTIEFFDRKTKDALWVGWGSKRLSKSSDDRDAVIKEAVQKILLPFPAKM